LRDDLNTNSAFLVYVEVSEGSGEVGREIVFSGGTLEALMGSENLSRSTSDGGLGHGEDTSGFAFLTILVAEFALIGVVHDHGSHEEVIITRGEVLGGNSFVFLIERTSSDLLRGVESRNGLTITSNLEESIIIRVGRIAIGILFSSLLLSGSIFSNIDSSNLLNREGSNETDSPCPLQF
jgi:hypothetical protein